MTSSKNQDHADSLSEFGQAAQLGAAFGLKMFPLKRKDKSPLRAGWQQSATADSETIRELWTEAPTANVGWLTGEPSGYFVIDIDGQAGEEQLTALAPRLGSLPPTVEVETPGKIDPKTGEHKGKGRHLIFTCPPDGVPGRTGIVPGIDIKSTDGYCVFPPSEHPDGTGRYRFVPGRSFSEITVADCPTAWIEWIRKGKDKAKKPPKQSAGPSVNLDDRLLNRVLAYLGKCDPAVQDGTGHKTLLTVANALVHGFCLEPVVAGSIAWEHYNPRCSPPWSAEQRYDFNRKFNEAVENPPNKPWGWLLHEERVCGTTGSASSDTKIPNWTKESPKIESASKEEKADKRSQKPEIGPVLISFDEIEETEVSWLLQDVFPMGMVSVLAGKPGQGKSFLTCWLSAAVSGEDTILFRRGPIPKGSVIICNAEDDAGKIIKKRLRTNGSDLSKVKTIPHVLVAGRGQDGKTELYESPITLEMIDAFEQAFIATPDCRLLIVDPVSAFWGDTNDQKNAEVRVVVAKLKRLAEKFNIAIILVTHLNKSASSDSSTRITGSGGLPAAGRANWLLSQDETELGTVSIIKTNISENKAGFTFRILDGRVTIIDQEIAVSADEILQAEIEARLVVKGRKPKQLEAAKEWLADFLKDGRKPAGSRDDPQEGTVYYEAAQRGIKPRTLQDAAKELGVKYIRETSVHFWSIEEADELVRNSSAPCTLGNSCAPSPCDLQGENDLFSRCATTEGIQGTSCTVENSPPSPIPAAKPGRDVFTI